MSIRNINPSYVQGYVDTMERIERIIVANKGAILHDGDAAMHRVLRECDAALELWCDAKEADGCDGCRTARCRWHDCAGLEGTLVRIIIHMHERGRHP